MACPSRLNYVSEGEWLVRVGCGLDLRAAVASGLDWRCPATAVPVVPYSVREHIYYIRTQRNNNHTYTHVLC